MRRRRLRAGSQSDVHLRYVAAARNLLARGAAVARPIQSRKVSTAADVFRNNQKLVVASTAAGFLNRRETVLGTMVVVSNGVPEDVFGQRMREMRVGIATLGGRHAL
jgi:hypothetical protein